MKDNQENIFQTPIWGFMLKDQHYQTYDYVDKVLELQSKETSEKKSNFGGWQSRDNLNDTEGIFREFISTLEKISNNILCDKSNKRFKVTEMWANVNYKYCYNAAHTHGGILSGVFYLQVPENSGKLIFCNPAVRADGHLLRPKNYPIVPERLACIMFPSWLEHYVEPNLSDEPRISISFNIG
jgi:uncharacterized protein (TIGR02466 family)